MTQSGLSIANRFRDEKQSAQLDFQLEESDGTDLTKSELSTITLTLYNFIDGTIINSRNAQNVKDQNNVSISSGGLVTWTEQPSDHQIVSSNVETGATETHVALFEWTTSGGGENSLEIFYFVRQMNKRS